MIIIPGGAELAGTGIAEISPTFGRQN